eukprot:gene20523-15489_t
MSDPLGPLPEGVDADPEYEKKLVSPATIKSSQDKASYQGGFNYPAGFTGEGQFAYTDGSKYEGAFVDSMKHGKGKMTYPNGAVYEGDWVKGLHEGNGEYTMQTGNKYVGSFKDDMMDGSGTFTWKNGNVYVGDFKEDTRTGNGKFTHFLGTIILDGAWDQNQFRG